MLLSMMAFVIWIPATLGWGSIVLLTLSRYVLVKPSPMNLAVLQFIGFAILSVIVDLLNFWTRISPLISLIAVLVGITLFIVNLRGILYSLTGYQLPNFGGNRGVIALFIPSIVLVSLSAAFFSQHAVAVGQPLYDLGLYHLQTVKWITESPLPRGLANLHGRFGFNSSWFSVAAILELPFAQGKSSFILNGMVYLVYGSIVVASIVQAFRHESKSEATSVNFSQWFIPATSAIWFGSGFLLQMASPSPDIPILYLTLLIIYLLLRALDNLDEMPFSFFVTFCLSTFAITIKLSAIPLLLVPLLIFIAARNRSLFLKWTVVASLIIASVINSVWIIRGIAISGCAVYPLESTCIHSLEWAVPNGYANHDALWIMSWARAPDNFNPGEVLSNWAWFSPWFKVFLDSFTLSLRKNQLFSNIAIVAYIGLLAWAAALFKDRRYFLKGLTTLAIAGMAIALGLTYWFFTAPDPRFAFGYFAAGSALLFCAGLSRVQQTYRIANLAKIVAALALVFICLDSVYPIYGLIRIQQPIPISIWPSVPSNNSMYTEQRTLQGITVYTPTKGDQCWDAPLPCTPYFDPSLRININSTGSFDMIYHNNR